jgi:hypothetical protein
VAGDLRAIVSSLQIAADLDRMGALALQVAKMARRRHPMHVLPERCGSRRGHRHRERYHHDDRRAQTTRCRYQPSRTVSAIDDAPSIGAHFLFGWQRARHLENDSPAHLDGVVGEAFIEATQ